MSDIDRRLREAAEKLALTLAEGGMQKTTARVMAALLFSRRDSMTAADICEELAVSSGAVSTSVNQLIPIGLVERVPAPRGSRREHYRFRQGAWANLMSQQNAVLTVMETTAREGLDLVGPSGEIGRRLHEMHSFYAFMADNLPRLIDDWRQRHRS